MLGQRSEHQGREPASTKDATTKDHRNDHRNVDSHGIVLPDPLDCKEITVHYAIGAGKPWTTTLVFRHVRGQAYVQSSTEAHEWSSSPTAYRHRCVGTASGRQVEMDILFNFNHILVA